MSEDKPKHNPQSHSWKVVKIYDDYSEADDHRNDLVAKGNKVKVNRRGVYGKLFAVKVGTPIKKEEADEGS